MLLLYKRKACVSSLRGWFVLASVVFSVHRSHAPPTHCPHCPLTALSLPSPPTASNSPWQWRPDSLGQARRAIQPNDLIRPPVPRVPSKTSSKPFGPPATSLLRTWKCHLFSELLVAEGNATLQRGRQVWKKGEGTKLKSWQKGPLGGREINCARMLWMSVANVSTFSVSGEYLYFLSLPVCMCVCHPVNERAFKY